MGQCNFTYCQKFQWSSSALVDLISVDQLLILDNVLSYSDFHTIEHRECIYFPLHIDTLPCESTKDEILAALMQLLPWVCVCMYLHACECAWVMYCNLTCIYIPYFLDYFPRVFQTVQIIRRLVSCPDFTLSRGKRSGAEA